jgi:hypothetical protein
VNTEIVKLYPTLTCMLANATIDGALRTLQRNGTAKQLIKQERESIWSNTEGAIDSVTNSQPVHGRYTEHCVRTLANLWALRALQWSPVVSLRPRPAWERRTSTCERALLPHADKHMFVYVLELCKSEAKRPARSDCFVILLCSFPSKGLSCVAA